VAAGDSNVRPDTAPVTRTTCRGYDIVSVAEKDELKGGRRV